MNAGTGHGKIERPLPNGDVLIHDSTRTRPEVEEAFRRAEEEVKRGFPQLPHVQMRPER